MNFLKFRTKSSELLIKKVELMHLFTGFIKYVFFSNILVIGKNTGSLLLGTSSFSKESC